MLKEGAAAPEYELPTGKALLTLGAEAPEYELPTALLMAGAAGEL